MTTTIRQAGRATGRLLIAALMAFGTYLFVTVLLIAAIGTLVVVGAWMLPEAVLLIRRIAGAKRRQVAGWTGREIPEAYEPLTGTLRERLRTAVRDPGTLADLRWMAAHYVYGWLVLLALPLWPVGLVVDGVWCGLLRRDAVVLPWVVRLADVEARWSAALLKPSPKARLAARVRALTETRADAIAAHGAELRRIERDLHDGAQARLVALSMRIGLAQRAFDRDPDSARKLMADAQDQAEQALTELRHVVRGIHPPILTDRGLTGAVRALAAGSGLEVTVRVEGLLDSGGVGSSSSSNGGGGGGGGGGRGGAVGPSGGPGGSDGSRGYRAPAAVEAAAYFAVAEALTNVVKHSGSPRAAVELVRLRNGLRAVVRDEGLGGADEGAGSGLLGIRRRVAALDGVVNVDSPAGGPTTIAVELPCVW
ncbi:sensor histidine kinase [Streptomyces asoensis]|uniref:histidine kinase n=1 Tax=Streptomyces asoensis TaxID=249586 RepID=A0A6M4X5L2_9ACTN|nr:histidine kinase [Streptomyces asoensis]QJT06985.1 sensor histidine kinase [Streptomyces asoensis]